MPIKYFDSPFHVTQDEETASKMAMKMDLSIMLTRLIKAQGWTQIEAAEYLDVNQSRISELKNAKIELFSIDAMFDMLDKLGFRTKMTMPTLDEATIAIKRVQAT